MRKWGTKALRKSASKVPPGSPEAVKSLSGKVAYRLGVDIVSGRLTPGTLLATEVDAAIQFGVSRTAYREAVRVLASKGLVESRQKTGTRVNPRERWALLDPEILGWMFANEPGVALVQELFELRRVVEPAAAAFAAMRRSAGQLDAMTAALDDMARLGLESEEGRRADENFHRIVLEATGNEFFGALDESISAAIRWTTILKFRARRKPRDPIVAHRDLLAAIVDADPDRARAAATLLIDQAREDTEALVRRNRQ